MIPSSSLIQGLLLFEIRFCSIDSNWNKNERNPKEENTEKEEKNDNKITEKEKKKNTKKMKIPKTKK